ncbi:MAG: tRNA (adenosine(37)-N6)-dimethylallyltransferase MiaA [Candidatus Omnitrophica bacterium]|nr:tRNA (adenosine(37)-N6)-dimethylallyltransferase MiaA [Candidatus Omnitrophota bacterium]
MPSTIIFIVGPTAIGKTALAVKLAKKVNGEIISCDSMQVYKGMKILSQAPGLAEKRSARHHLVGSLDPEKEYNVADFRKKATKIIEAIIRRKKIPIVAGGSGLYVKGLVDGLFPSPKADLKFRKSMETIALKAGSGKLHEKLRKLDPESARLIHPNDRRRIVRALEIYNATGRTMTELKSQTRGLRDSYDIKIYGLIKPREEIYASINSRVEKMFKLGLVREVRSLKRVRLSRTAKEVLGYKEIAGYINGDYDLDTASVILKRRTRRFAKRQLSWFRGDRRIEWIDLGKTSTLAAVRKIAREVK